MYFKLFKINEFCEHPLSMFTIIFVKFHIDMITIMVGEGGRGFLTHLSVLIKIEL